MITTFIPRFIRGSEGQDLIEYALLVGVIAVAVTGFLTAFVGGISTEFGVVSAAFAAAS